MKLADILQNKNLLDENYTLLGTGGYAKVYLIDEERVLKISDHKSDGFRHVATLPSHKRKEIGFVNIHESFLDNESELMYFLTERLYPLSVSQEQEKSIKRINAQLCEHDYSFDFLQYNEIEQDIINKSLKLKLYMPSHLDYDWDIHPSNLMVTKDGQIRLSDPIAECMPVLKEEYTAELTKQIIDDKNMIAEFLNIQSTQTLKMAESKFKKSSGLI